MDILRILTIASSLIIIIGAGHGVAPIGLFEFAMLSDLRNLHFNISGNYDDRLRTVALLSLLGQCFLISSFFFDSNLKQKLTLTGCLILFAAVFILTTDPQNLSTLSFLTALPFIATALFLSIKELRILTNN